MTLDYTTAQLAKEEWLALKRSDSTEKQKLKVEKVGLLFGVNEKLLTQHILGPQVQAVVSQQPG